MTPQPTREAVILLVEDSPADVMLTKRAMSKAGFSFRMDVVMDGVEALEYLLGSDAEPAQPLPQLVLLDLKLPRMDGHQVLERIRATERTRRLPVIVLTSSVEEADLAKSYDRGVNSYIQKPVDFSSFVEAARQVGLYWLRLNQGPPLPSPSRP